MGKGYLIVEGHGDGRAALNLVHRMWGELGLAHVTWDPIPSGEWHCTLSSVS